MPFRTWKSSLKVEASKNYTLGLKNPFLHFFLNIIFRTLPNLMTNILKITVKKEQ